MLECSPPLPIVLDYTHLTRRWTEEDEDGILLALRHHARLHRICLFVPPSHESKLFVAIEKEFPMLEYLYIEFSPLANLRPGLDIYSTFQAPRLCHLALTRCPFLVTSSSLTTSTGLVTLTLMLEPRSRHHPYDLFRRLPLLSQLVVLRIGISWILSTHELEGQRLDIPYITHLTLPNLRLFEFDGEINYLETLLPLMTTPLLEKLQITLSKLTAPLPIYTFPCLLQFMSKADGLGFASAEFFFRVRQVTVWVYPREGAIEHVFCLRIYCGQFSRQVSDMASIFEDLSPAFSAVDDLTIDYSGHKAHNSLYGEDPRPMQWCDLLRSFNHAKTLRVHSVFAENFSRSLLSDGEPLPEVLPELQVLECPVGCDASAAFATFVHARNAAGHPMRLILVDPPGRSPTSTDL